MPLSEKQRALLVEEAKRRGLDEETLIAEAEKYLAERTKAGNDEGRTPQAAEEAKPSKDADDEKDEKPTEAPKPLCQCHLPFVTVNEVREVWLGLKPIAGGEENAAKYAARQLAGAAGPAASSGDDPAKP